MSVDWSIVNKVVWVAAFLEGEGCFYSVRSTPVIAAGSTDRDVIERATEFMNGRMYDYLPSGPKKKWMYHVRVYGLQAAQWMMTVYALMGSRRRTKIEEVLGKWRRHVYLKDRTTCPYGHAYDYFLTLPNGQSRRYCKECCRRYSREYGRRQRARRME